MTLDQSRAVVHADASNPNDTVGFSGSGLITLTATVTDGDGDQDSASTDITGSFELNDDAPSIVRNGTVAPTLVVDETNLGVTDSSGFAGLFTPTFGNDGFKDSDNDDTEDADAVAYGLSVNGANAASGLTDTQSNESVVLNVVGGDVVGTTATGGVEVLRISVDGNTGDVTLDQSRAAVSYTHLRAHET